MSDDLVSQAITGWFGERCDESLEGCVVCDAWAQYDALKVASEWQTIESAPKDGSEFLAIEKDTMFVCLWDKWACSWSIGGEWNMKPTHWQPLPLPPSD